MAIPWRTYQSAISSPDIARFRMETETNPNIGNVSPLIVASYDGQMQEQSEALYKNGTQKPYRFAQSVRTSWNSQFFDWETEQLFEVNNFASAFGNMYEAGVQALPSYQESRLLYGR